jgi:hypothetical protein
MPRKNITLRVDEKLFERFQEYSKEKCIVISRKFDQFMKEELEREGK